MPSRHRSSGVSSSSSLSPYGYDFPVIRTESSYCRLTHRPTVLSSSSPVRLTADRFAPAIDAQVLFTSEGNFRKLLQNHERVQLQRKKSYYRGGLDIPHLDFLGINLDSMTEQHHLVSWARKTDNWDERSKALHRVLSRVNTNKRCYISGAVSVRGKRGDKVNLFIKYAKIHLRDNKIVKVISGDLADLVVVNEKGDVLDSQEPMLNISRE